MRYTPSEAWSHGRRLSPRPIATVAVLVLLGAAAPVTGTGVSPAGPAAVAPAQGGALEIPEACDGPNPFLATARYVRGTTFPNEPAIIAFRDTSDDSGVMPLAPVREVGAIYGLAYDGEARLLYAGAYHKRNSAFGPLGPGGIYALDIATGDLRRLMRVPNAGNDLHHREDDYQPDQRGRSYVGKTGLGDIELSEDGNELFAANLADRRIYRLAVQTGDVMASFPHGAATEPWANDARPFALAVREGWLYHGVTRTAYTSQNPEELAAYVYASLPDGSGMREVAAIALDHDRGRHQRWAPWPRRDDFDWDVTEHPHPMLTDIAFDASGNMILGLRDRFIDTGPSLTEMYRVAPGDILRLEPDGYLQWRLAPGSPEHYVHDDLPGWHDEIAIGGLAQLPDRDVVVTTAIDPQRTFSLGARLVGSISAGALWFDNPTAADLGREELMVNSLRHAGPYGKANGLGDVEVLCAARVPTPTPTGTATVERTATATPTPTKTSTATMTATRTPTDTRTPSPERFAIYLPAARRQPKCVSEYRRADVVLVLDRSTSMMRPSADGGVPKNRAAIEAASAFARLLALAPDDLEPHDQIGIVGFNDVAWAELPLTDQLEGAISALDRIADKTAEGTRLDLALDEGQRVLESTNRRADNQPVMVLLTDGLPNRVPTPAPGGLQEETVLAHAEAVNSAGTRIYTIGLGEPDDVLKPLLERVASSPDMAYNAPNAEDLEAIYRQIAGRIVRCPGSG